MYGNNPLSGKFYNIRGIKIYCEVYGSGKPVLMIHGNGGSIKNFENNIAYFSKKYRVIVADSRAQGKSKDRGDSLSVVNSSFMVASLEKMADIPIWKQPEVIDMVVQILKYLAGGAVLFLLYKKLLKPMANKLVQLPNPALLSHNGVDAVVNLGHSTSAGTSDRSARGYQNNLDSAKQVAKDNPRMVASVVTNWVNGND